MDNPSSTPTPISADSANPQVESRARPWLIALLALVVGIGIGVLATKYYPDLSRLGPTPQPSPTPSKTRSSVTLPISPANRSVIVSGATYTLEGKIYSVKPVTGDKNGWRLIMTGRDGTIFFDNPFSLTNDTPIASASAQNLFKPVPANAPRLSPAVLSADQKILIHYYYDLTSGVGQVTSLVAETR